MRYMDRLNGTTRTLAPVVNVAAIHGRLDARKAASHHDRRSYAESSSYREMSAMMRQSTGFCG